MSSYYVNLVITEDFQMCVYIFSFPVYESNKRLLSQWLVSEFWYHISGRTR